MKNTISSITYDEFYNRYVFKNEDFVFNYFSIQLKFIHTASGMCLIYSDSFKTRTMMLPDNDSLNKVTINNMSLKHIWANLNLINK